MVASPIILKYAAITDILKADNKYSKQKNILKDITLIRL